ncbi:outer membrane homotrimeric porin [uncultured Desulfovibrio sp.]|uniref:outer membrane homotrimeric porin n=1 Tax=uncultured Desulfovibrio sp. TaxID=167968 RepID=UPI0026199F18|nr:outer membrane homotrimeric porin [uncultured Desulfovibrio sp.]
MKRILTLMLAAAMTLGATSGAQAIDFKASGEWLMGLAAGDASLVQKDGGKRTDTNDVFGAGQRVRLQLDAVASEALSGTVFFEIGDQLWGNGESGAAMGADGQVVKVKNAYLDWVVPNTDLQIRMGIQAIAMPDAAGGSAVMDGDVAGIVASYKFNDNVALTATWMRPFNDNYAADENDPKRRVNFLDNIDLFALSLPLSFDGVEVTPWVMYGIQGRNARYNLHGWEQADGDFAQTLGNTYAGFNWDGRFGSTSKGYGSMFWAGLPIKVTALDPWNIEFDVNYGYVEKMGRINVLNGETGRTVRASTGREGWAVKALVEYKMDWGTPGIFGWYASGDDGNIKNGSERLPSLNGNAGFTSFMGTADADWSGRGNLYEKTLTIDGTWGIGVQVADMSFVENLNHTFRVAYWGGTNSPSMVKYMNSPRAFDMDGDACSTEGPYLTTNDGLLEFNLTNVWQVYENLTASLELGYIVNMIDKNTWDRSFFDSSFSRQDAWKASLVLAYTF